jgi:hypothetical protein
MNAISSPITKNVAIKPNKRTCVSVQPVVFASLIDVIPTDASAPITTRAMTEPIIVFRLTNFSLPIYSLL